VFLNHRVRIEVASFVICFPVPAQKLLGSVLLVYNEAVGLMVN